MSFVFRPVVRSDLSLLHKWQSMPHVAEWWGEPDQVNDDQQGADPNIAMWIVETDGRPFAFAQDYDPHAWAGHPFYHLPPGSRGIDQYIGEVDMLDRGLGTEFVRQHVARLLATGAPAIGTDPHPNNGRARRCYQKVGFRAVTGPVQTEWGAAILMEKWE